MVEVGGKVLTGLLVFVGVNVNVFLFVGVMVRVFIGVTVRVPVKTSGVFVSVGVRVELGEITREGIAFLGGGNTIGNTIGVEVPDVRGMIAFCMASSS
jgi:hypothetical protein